MITKLISGTYNIKFTSDGWKIYPTDNPTQAAVPSGSWENISNYGTHPDGEYTFYFQTDISDTQFMEASFDSSGVNEGSGFKLKAADGALNPATGTGIYNISTPSSPHYYQTQITNIIYLTAGKLISDDPKIKISTGQSSTVTATWDNASGTWSYSVPLDDDGDIPASANAQGEVTVHVHATGLPKAADQYYSALYDQGAGGTSRTGTALTRKQMSSGTPYTTTLTVTPPTTNIMTVNLFEKSENGTGQLIC